MTQNAFKLDRHHRVESLKIDIHAFTHQATGARHLHLACDDDNNAFMVAFPTIPEDSTGVAHILEHTTLCGSKRYPVRDPFFMMLRRSLNTFMNAFTSSDSTAYPFATRNRQDFDNLLGIYLDAVFFPNLDPLDFAQEGCRIEFASPEDPSQGLVYKGVVFNEMKGAMSSAVAQLWQHVQGELMIDTAYRFNSGGDPAAIPLLTHARLKAFHAQHYHPSQAVFITYGNFPALEHQSKFEALALQQFARSEHIIVSPRQPPRSLPRVTTTSYAIDDPEAVANATHIVWGWLLGEATTPRDLLEAHLLTGVLLDHSASPLRHYLETTPHANAPSELCTLDDSARQMAFLCGVEGSEAAHAEVLEREILATLTKVADEGVPAAMLHAALDRIEMAQRDISGDGFPYGLQLMSRMLPGAMYRADPVALLDIDALLEALRSAINDPNYFRALVRRLLLTNQHRVRVTMVPDATKRQREQADERARLQAEFERLSSADYATLATQAAALAARQARHDDPTILPKITLADVPATAAPVTGTARMVHGRRVNSYLRGTNGVMHAQLIFDLPALTPAELRVLPLFSAYLLEFGIGEESYLETQERRAQVGSFGATTLVRTQLGDLEHHSAHFVLTAKGLRRHGAAMLPLLEEVLHRVRFDETERLTDLLAQTRADLEQSVTDRGHQLAMHVAARGISKSGWLSEAWGGLSSLRAIQQLDDASDAEVIARLLATFDGLRSKLNAARNQVLLVGEEDALSLANAWLEGAPARAVTAAERFTVPSPGPSPSLAWMVNGDVNFCAKAYPAVPEGHPDAPALTVLGRYLSDGFLHPAIREKGGAYGSGATFDGDNGCFSFYSYRDPRLRETCVDFDRALEWFAATDDPARLEESILGVIRALDKPRSPAGAAIDAFYSDLQARTVSVKAEFRAKVLSTTYQELSVVAARYLHPARGTLGLVTHRGEQATIDALGVASEAL